MTIELTPRILLKCGILEEYHDKDFTDFYGHPQKWKELYPKIQEWNLLHPHKPINITHEHHLEARNVLEKIALYTKNLSNARKKGISLLLAGNNGSGKTLLGVSILKEALRKGFSVQMTSLSGIITLYAGGWRDEEKARLFESRIRDVDFLLIDDVGKEYEAKSSDLTEVLFDNLIRYRVNRRKPYILTTNTDPQSFQNRYGASLMSLIEGKAIKLKVIGVDFRKEILSKNLWEELQSE